jgi:hypothetical protein
MQGLYLPETELTYQQLREVPTPEPTGTHYPIPHHELVSAVFCELEGSGLRVTDQGHGVTAGGNQYFGAFQVENGQDYEDRKLLIGMRNSHDKKFRAALALGTRVMVCSNMSFSGETEVARMHTRHIGRDLPRLVSEAVGRLGDYRQRQDERIEAYKNSNLSDPQMNDLLVRSMNAKVISSQQIAKVQRLWHEPNHEEFTPRTVWSAFNAFTEELKGRHDIARRTQRLHGLCDLRSGVAV